MFKAYKEGSEALLVKKVEFSMHLNNGDVSKEYIWIKMKDDNSINQVIVDIFQPSIFIAKDRVYFTSNISKVTYKVDYTGLLKEPVDWKFIFDEHFSLTSLV